MQTAEQIATQIVATATKATYENAKKLKIYLSNGNLGQNNKQKNK